MQNGQSVFLASLPSLALCFQPHSRPFVDCSRVLEYAKIRTVLQSIFSPIRSSLSLEIRSPPPPLGRILVPSTDCGQGLKRSFQTIPNMNTTRSRTPENKAKTGVTLTWKFPWKFCSTTHLPFLSFNPKVLTAFPTKIKPTKIPAI